MSLLEVTDLSIGFHMPGRDVQVVDKVSFTLDQGKTWSRLKSGLLRRTMRPKRLPTYLPN